ncbi:MAG TPA: ABC transporter permease [Kiritimatiellia bacterium]|jgi:spermidine/putrescine transport system permease protein|nr:ABC transporter permease [Kiritimatiellia bacterium]OQC59046.1 MAG: Putrescine transport system permease protein PotH [Verrucomicrobia bacterium ADurb.Bin018]MBP9571797.1 ABC transporter permease [Kiritimatiellia bacterium]HOE36845.1 ABC transporter permease [Kiritimatiellia bacterium]HOR74224.1 ABC transporter permease [Kiritimatiellia bacterium]
MKAQRRVRVFEWLVTLPSLVWLLVLFLIPTVLVFAITFKPATPYGGIGSGWTLETLRTLGNPNYPAIVWRTIWLSVVVTALCIVLATPMGYYMARISPRRRQMVLLLVILPFWTSFLVRIFAWKVLLHPEGLLKQLLVFLHLCTPDTSLLYNTFAVLLVMVYTELPFAILPIYAASEKFDFRLIEAAKDLGATSFRAFRAVFLPGIRVGLLTAFLMVFIPSLGSYVIPDIVGGPTSEMIGNKIAQRTFVDRNLPHAAGLSALLTLAVLIPMITITTLRRKESPKDALREEGV